jgi:UDP-glucose 4-epimerase
MKIVVTGAGGFLGRATVEQVHKLIPGAEVIATDRARSLAPDNKVQMVDVTDRIMVNAAVTEDVDAVIHLAGMLGTAELFDTPHQAINVNVHGSLNVIERCAEVGAAYVAISMPPVFSSVYTATKMCADRFATAWSRHKGLRVAHVVAYNAYGPGQKHGPGHPQKIIPTFATEAWAGRPIPVWGDGMQTVDLVHADDIGRCLAEAAKILHEWGPKGFRGEIAIDAGTGYPVTVLDVAEFVIKHTGSTAGVEHLPMRAGEEPTHIVATGTGWGLMGENGRRWHPEFSWARLADTIDAYRPGTDPAKAWTYEPHDFRYEGDE